MYRESLEKLEELLERNHATQREVDRALAQKKWPKQGSRRLKRNWRSKHLSSRTRTQLEQRRVLSPIDGVVTRVYKDEGEFVSPSDPVVVKVVQLDPLLIVFSVPVAEAPKLAAEETVQSASIRHSSQSKGWWNSSLRWRTPRAARCAYGCEFPIRTKASRAE